MCGCLRRGAVQCFLFFFFPRDCQHWVNCCGGGINSICICAMFFMITSSQPVLLKSLVLIGDACCTPLHLLHTRSSFVRNSVHILLSSKIMLWGKTGSCTMHRYIYAYCMVATPNSHIRAPLCSFRSIPDPLSTGWGASSHGKLKMDSAWSSGGGFWFQLTICKMKIEYVSSACSRHMQKGNHQEQGVSNIRGGRVSCMAFFCKAWQGCDLCEYWLILMLVVLLEIRDEVAWSK